MTPTRHHDRRASFRDFREAILVRCPSCGELAELRRSVSPQRYRCACTACGHVRDWTPDPQRGFPSPGPGPRLAAPFDLELWLQTPCRGHVLWAYDVAHLDELERFVRAELRERERHAEHGWSNGSLASRLPRWLKAAENRSDVLRGLNRLRRTLDG